MTQDGDQIAQLEADLAEFKATSKELEAEMEAELVESEARAQRLEAELAEAQRSVQYWKIRAERATTDAATTQKNLNSQIDSLKDALKSGQQRLLAAELENDDMERNGRAVEASAIELQEQNAQLMEKLAIYQAEVKEKVNLSEQLQRAKDELRETQDELEAQRKREVKSRAAEPDMGHQRNISDSLSMRSLSSSRSLRKIAGMINQVNLMEDQIAGVRKRMNGKRVVTDQARKRTASNETLAVSGHVRSHSNASFQPLRVFSRSLNESDFPLVNSNPQRLDLRRWNRPTQRGHGSPLISR